MKFKNLVLLLLPLSVALTANAEAKVTDEPEKNVISFNTEVTKEVDYDVMEVTLFVKQENKNLKELNQAINEKVNAALDVIKKQSAVQIKKNTRNTQVRYDNKGKQSGWTERADLVLESKDFVVLSQVISDLNETFAIADVMQKLSNEAAVKFEDEMLKSALAQFQHKAQLIQTSLNAKGYEVISLGLDSRNEIPYLGGRMIPVAKIKSFASEVADEVSLDSNDKAELKTSVSAQIRLLN
ncbi:SIMPL domain-containing protein [Aggregatibacter actinomycetemcomitans]|uniref:SIMPL domain-containing protein n=1 Tax=Aggregatibacter actinomycetemcomitans TaxID=714 RepID=UPI00197BEAFC|nr:SIMPL domain-containing protein [Aggregatibacter actinomycetemcomitans]MBN6081545.1 SIMPL domain-containing protein [Aggregatibacter actinomycetemcomitans]